MLSGISIRVVLLKSFYTDPKLLAAWVVAAVFQIGGCATLGQSTEEPKIAECRALFAQVDKAVDRAAVRDHGPVQISGFPYLRVDRLLASFRDEVDEPEQFRTWTKSLAALDAEARTFELRNLPAGLRGAFGDHLTDRLDTCRERLTANDLSTEEGKAALRRAAVVPDDYVTWWRIAGLYPITALFVSHGVEKWHREAQATFAVPLEQLPVAGTLTRWRAPPGTPLDTRQVEAFVEDTKDTLGIPRPDADAMQRLFDTFAPTWEVDVVDDNDRIGRIGRPLAGGVPSVDTDAPTMYRLVSYARLDGRVLLQLNYIIWFPGRPGDDIYAGRLDGLIWRVTLGPDGKPIIYDSIHNCGCYHQFFPTPALTLRGDLPRHYFEPPLLPQPAPASDRPVVRIAHGTHFIERVYESAGETNGEPLAWQDYDTLRSLPSGDGYRSLFGPYGIVPGSERGERFILWPMGIRSPGAMRQWGRHAVAFVGRRHFDDPFLISTVFSEVEGGATRTETKGQWQ